MYESNATSVWTDRFVFNKNDHKCPDIFVSDIQVISVLYVKQWIALKLKLWYIQQRVSRVEQELLPLPKHLSSPRFLVGIVVSPFVLFLLVIVVLIFLYSRLLVTTLISSNVSNDIDAFNTHPCSIPLFCGSEN
jgi:hypothetical protein